VGRARGPVEALERDARTGLLALLVLRLLVEEGPLHGYGVRRRIAEATGLEPPESSVYDALRRLERLGLVEGYWAVGPEGTVRKYYKPRPHAGEVLAAVVERLSRLAAPVLCGGGGGGG